MVLTGALVTRIIVVWGVCGMRAGENRYISVAWCNGKVTEWVCAARRTKRLKEVLIYARNICYICGS